MLYSEEQIQRANERSISEYFRQAGYSCKRVGAETHIEGFGGFYVKDTTVQNPFYIHSQQKGGVGLEFKERTFRKLSGLIASHQPAKMGKSKSKYNNYTVEFI